MPRPKKDGAPEPKKRSRNGCWPCKARKVKCGEEKPRCLNCARQGETCDYSIRLNWGGRSKKNADDRNTPTPPPPASPHSPIFPIFPTPEALGIRTRTSSPTPSATYSEPAVQLVHSRKRSYLSLPPDEPPLPPIDPSIYCGDHGPTSAPLSGTFKQDYLHLDSFRQQHPSSFHRDITSAPIDPRIEGLGIWPSPNYVASPSARASPYPDAVPPSSLYYDRAGTPNSAILPPFSSFSSPRSPYEPPLPGFGEAVQHHTKRMRYSPLLDPSPDYSRSLQPAVEDSMLFNRFTSSLSPGNTFNFAPTPLTPGNALEDATFHMPAPPTIKQTQDVEEQPRKLSVQDLLSTPRPDDILTPQTPDSWPSQDADTTAYGYDLGSADDDIPRNDDASAIRVIGSPEARRLVYHSAYPLSVGNAADDERDRPIAFNRGGYYAKPVAIRIPKGLEPLPNKLTENPMNLLYFHHFLNHTARILVPHDCEQNPFRNILPQLAIEDDNILNLMLAYSASHRARLLQHPEPATRIAEYVQDVFPKLRQALSSSNSFDQLSTTNLASAIMLASLEIMSPNTFAWPISWKNHLTIARTIVSTRATNANASGTVYSYARSRNDKVAYFLSRWFAYLDVLGSLSGSKNDWPLPSSYWFGDEADTMEDEFQIDCLLGFTTRCVGILARIAELAKSCERERIDADGHVNADWKPSAEVVAQAETLKLQLQEGRGHVSKACAHRRPNVSESELAWEGLEIYATNEAFHWAGLIHLTRRVLGKPSKDVEVQNAVKEIVGALGKVRRGSTAEACLLFPMFTAGCDALSAEHRRKLAERMRGVEGFGMTHVKKARRLMEQVWDTGKPWESLVSDEFFG